MPDNQNKSPDVVGKVGDFIKTWLPIVITIGGLVTGYFVLRLRQSTNLNFKE